MDTTTTLIELYFHHNLKEDALHFQESKVKYEFKFKQINLTKSEIKNTFLFFAN